MAQPKHGVDYDTFTKMANTSMGLEASLRPSTDLINELVHLTITDKLVKRIKNKSKEPTEKWKEPAKEWRARQKEWAKTEDGQKALKNAEAIWPSIAQKARYGDVASWLVWGVSPTLSAPNSQDTQRMIKEYKAHLFGDELPDDVLKIQFSRIGGLLNTDFIFVSVNWAGTPDGAPYGGAASTWHNFHDQPGLFHSTLRGKWNGPEQVLSRLFQGTPVEGCWMTDAFKGIPSPTASKLAAKAKESPLLTNEMRNILEQERQLLKANDHPICWIVTGNNALPVLGENDGFVGDDATMPLRKGDMMIHIPFYTTIGRRKKPGDAGQPDPREAHMTSHAAADMFKNIIRFCDSPNVGISYDKTVMESNIAAVFKREENWKRWEPAFTLD
ncbi:hypothetical protein JS532_02920 [Bifidobacterium callimiconis]|uniref:hypothetical protein n=1 Tax=Bifidobacterium callimiconis TaxID=2306973 RepID=UPI001BDD58D6|nr:hypothetical protein [Bifidobacterium callimiconis]MBT1176517.1 hypothetical protein [Bifidobacterium callimiconis]